jgi:hypothetical protein
MTRAQFEYRDHGLARTMAIYVGSFRGLARDRNLPRWPLHTSLFRAHTGEPPTESKTFNFHRFGVLKKRCLGCEHWTNERRIIGRPWIRQSLVRKGTRSPKAMATLRQCNVGSQQRRLSEQQVRVYLNNSFDLFHGGCKE